MASATSWESLAAVAIGAQVPHTDLRLGFLKKAQLVWRDQNTTASDVPAFHDFSLAQVKSWELVFTKHAYGRAKGIAEPVDGGAVTVAEKPRDDVLAVRRCMTGGVHRQFAPLIRRQPDTDCCFLQFHDCRFVAELNLVSKRIVVVTILPMYPRSRTEPVETWSGFLKDRLAVSRAAKVAKSEAASAAEAERKAAKRKATGGGAGCYGAASKAKATRPTKTKGGAKAKGGVKHDARGHSTKAKTGKPGGGKASGCGTKKGSGGDGKQNRRV